MCEINGGICLQCQLQETCIYVLHRERYTEDILEIKLLISNTNVAFKKSAGYNRTTEVRQVR